MITKEGPPRQGIIQTASKPIALFVPSLRGGGAERVMSVLARGLAEKGLSVDLVLVNAAGPYLADIPHSVRVIDLKSRRLLSALPGLVRYLRRERPTALLSTLFHANIIALWARALSRVSVRTVIRLPNMLNEGVGRKQNLKQKSISRLMTYAGRSADAVVALNDTMAAEFQASTQVPRNKIKVINNPFPVERIAVRAKEPLDHPWFKAAQPPVVLAVGRFVYQKGFDVLIEAFSLLRQQQAVRLIILGDGELRQALQARIDALGLSEDVALPGFDDNPYKYMHRAAAFVLPSRWEGFPNALAEAMACGAPVVATDCPGGCAEILQQGQWGDLVSVGDSKTLAAAISRTITADDHPDVESRAEDFSLDKAAERYLEQLLPDSI